VGRSKAIKAAPWALGVAALAVLIVVLTGGNGNPYHVNATISSALQLIPGANVREAGQIVGEVSSVSATRSGQARVQLAIDQRGWPLPRGTKMSLRWASSVAYGARWVELDKPASSRSGPIPDGGTIPTRDITVPVEFQDVFNTFDAPTLGGLRNTLSLGGQALSAARPGLRGTLAKAPPLLNEVNLVLGELDSSTVALDDLVRSSSRVFAAVQSANPGLRTLTSGAAATFAATGAQAEQLKATLLQTPPLFEAAIQTLGHADRTLNAAGALTQRLAPGVDQVRRLAAPLDRVLATVLHVGPDANATLATAGRSAPALSALLARARSLLPTLQSAAGQAAVQLNCVRPYAPDIAGFASNWDGFAARTDTHDHYFRIVASNVLIPNVTPLTPEQVHQTIPSLTSVFPRPPGQVGGHPWFIPECGVGPDTVNPAKDPEARGSG
jgi:virulence factor Mce-like protein